MLVAHARAEGATIIARDDHLRMYDVPLVW
jgi:PIN domain nuclease of toxin-antitoxin system